MPAERNAFKLGLTLLVILALFVIVLAFLAPRGGGDLALQVRFPHTQLTTLLGKGCPVRCGGETVGSVDRLELIEWTPPGESVPSLYSLVSFRVVSSLGLRDDCQIMPAGPLLGGSGELIIRDRGAGSLLKEGQVIDGTPGADFAAIMQSLNDELDRQDPTSLLAMLRGQLDSGNAGGLLGKLLRSLDDINQLTGRINSEFDKNERANLLNKLHGVMDNVNLATGLLRRELDHDVSDAALRKMHLSLDTLQSGLQSAAAMLDENREPIRQTLLNVQQTSAIVEERIAARIADQLDPADPAGLLAKVHVALDRLGGSLADLKAITADTREISTLAKPQIVTTIDNFKETSDHLKAAARELRSSPWRLLYQPTPQEAGTAHIADAARAFADAATRLDDAATRLAAYEQATDAPDSQRDPQLRQIRDDLQATFDAYKLAEQALWEQLKIR